MTEAVIPPGRLADGSECRHEGETSTYCTKCWTNLYMARQQLAQAAAQDSRLGATDAPDEIGYRYRTTLRRVAAAFLDGGALTPLQWLDMLVWNSTKHPVALTVWSLLNHAVGLGYSILFVARFGQTPGKMACNVRVLSLQGKLPTLRQAALRDIVPLLATPYFLIVAVGNIAGGRLANRGLGEDWLATLRVVGVFAAWSLVEFLTMVTNRKHRAVHDFIAGTVVIRESPAEGGGARGKWLLWLLLLLFVLGMLTPHLFTDKNFIVSGVHAHGQP